MKQEHNIHSKIDNILEQDKRFKREAYYFVLGALDYTLSGLKKPRHVSGKELLEGVRKYGQEQYGQICLTVFNHWGITETEHFGEIVFILVKEGLLSKTEEDNLEDFKGVFVLKEALGEKTAITVDKSRIKNFLHHHN